MRWILLAFLFMVFTAVFSQQLSWQQLREGFLQSLERKGALDSFIAKLEKIGEKSPAEECYYGICHALRTQYTSNTWNKIKLVSESRGFLNHAIERDRNDPELRFMRITLEYHLPFFLGLSKDIAADMLVISEHPGFASDSPLLKKMALDFLLSTHRCNSEENRILQQQLAELNKKQPGYYALSSNQ